MEPLTFLSPDLQIQSLSADPLLRHLEKPKAVARTLLGGGHRY